MSTLATNCPRCGTQKVTFSVLSAHCIETVYDASHYIDTVCGVIDTPDSVDTATLPDEPLLSVYLYETFCICNECKKSTVFVLKTTEDPATGEDSVTGSVEIVEYINQKHFVEHRPLEHVPENIKLAFKEGESCFAVGCFNATCTMFRLCVDLAAREKLEKLSKDGKAEISQNVKTGTLGAKLKWLFDNGKIPEGLRELSMCIKDYGNDGAHEGVLRKEDAEDLLDFTQQLLEHLYTAPKKVKLAKERRDARHNKNKSDS